MSFLNQYPSTPNQFQVFHPFSSQEAILDVVNVRNSAEALKTISNVITSKEFANWVKNGGYQVNLNAGALFLTGKIISKINTLLKQYGTVLYTVYATSPQTQQGALDGGFFVKEAPKYVPPIKVGGEVAPRLTDTEEALSDLFGQARQKQQAQKQALENKQSYPSLPSGNDGRLSLPFEFDPQSKVNHRWEDIPDLKEHFDKTPESLSFSTWKEPAINKQQNEPVAAPVELAPFQADTISPEQPTYYFSQTLRSGQSIKFDGNLIIIGDVNNGSEIAATGSILVWGELKGIAHAGAKGDTTAEIRAIKIEAVQIRIGKTIARRPDRVSYHKGSDNSVPQPEVARISDGEIRIFKDIVGYNN